MTKTVKISQNHRGEEMALLVGGQHEKNGKHLTKIFPKRTRQRSIISVTEMLWALCRSTHLTLIPSLHSCPTTKKKEEITTNDVDVRDVPVQVRLVRSPNGSGSAGKPNAYRERC